MTGFDLSALALGLMIGTVAGTAFFAGLRLGMNIALRSTKPVVLLVLSSAVRISALLGVGWLVTLHGGAWSFLGYATAFLIIRFGVTQMIGVHTPQGGRQ
jgi:F1F0 ATPase subunit 2